jgi:hypothetical protein
MGRAARDSNPEPLPFGRWVRLVLGDHEPRWQGPQGARRPMVLGPPVSALPSGPGLVDVRPILQGFDIAAGVDDVSPDVGSGSSSSTPPPAAHDGRVEAASAVAEQGQHRERQKW